MSRYGLRQIGQKADEIITRSILKEMSEPTLDEIDRAKAAIRKYNVYAERLETPMEEIDLPSGAQDLIGRVQTSTISRTTQNMALARILEKEKREMYRALIYAVDVAINAVSYRTGHAKKRTQLELDMRRYLSLEVGRPRTDKKLLMQHMPYVYKAIAECLTAGGF